MSRIYPHLMKIIFNYKNIFEKIELKELKTLVKSYKSKISKLEKEKEQLWLEDSSRWGDVRLSRQISECNQYLNKKLKKMEMYKRS